MSALEVFREAIDVLERAQSCPHGPPVAPETAQVAGNACVQLCGGDADRGRTLWKQIAHDLGGYFPHAAAVALIRGSSTTNLIPDIEAPDPS